MKKHFFTMGSSSSREGETHSENCIVELNYATESLSEQKMESKLNNSGRLSAHENVIEEKAARYQENAHNSCDAERALTVLESTYLTTSSANADDYLLRKDASPMEVHEEDEDDDDVASSQFASVSSSPAVLRGSLSHALLTSLHRSGDEKTLLLEEDDPGDHEPDCQVKSIEEELQNMASSFPKNDKEEHYLMEGDTRAMPANGLVDHGGATPHNIHYEYNRFPRGRGYNGTGVPGASYRGPGSRQTGAGNHYHGGNGAGNTGANPTGAGENHSQRLARNLCLKRFRHITKDLGYEYQDVTHPPFESINYVALDRRGKFRDMENILHAFGFFLHVQDKWVTPSAQVLSSFIRNSLFTVVVNFHSHSLDLSFHQMQLLFNKVQRKVGTLAGDIETLLKQQRYICPCGKRFEEAAAFWAHHRGDQGQQCIGAHQHVCQCGLVFEEHAAWVQHALAQIWPLCGMSMLGQLFALERLAATATCTPTPQAETATTSLPSSGGSIAMGLNNVPSGNATLPMTGTVDELPLFKCVGCEYVTDNYFLHYIHVVYCEKFLRQLQTNCPFCEEEVKQFYQKELQALEERERLQQRGTTPETGAAGGAGQQLSTTMGNDKEEASTAYENWTLILCKICLLFGITLEDVSNE